jgi:hypothetical protein
MEACDTNYTKSANHHCKHTNISSMHPAPLPNRRKLLGVVVHLYLINNRFLQVGVMIGASTAWMWLFGHGISLPGKFVIYIPITTL